MTPRPRNIVLDGVKGTFLPADDAVQHADLIRRAIDAMPSGYRPPDRLLLVESVLRCAYLVDVSDSRSVTGGVVDDVPVVTATEAASRVALSSRRIGQLCAQPDGPFPGARVSGRTWLIPTREFERWRDRREDEAA